MISENEIDRVVRLNKNLVVAGAESELESIVELGAREIEGRGGLA